MLSSRNFIAPAVAEEMMDGFSRPLIAHWGGGWGKALTINHEGLSG